MSNDIGTDAAAPTTIPHNTHGRTEVRPWGPVKHDGHAEEKMMMENENLQPQPSPDVIFQPEANTRLDDLGTTFTPEPAPTPEPGLRSKFMDKAAAAVSEQKDGLADRIDDIAKTVHTSGDQFAGKQDWVAGAIERGATELGSLANSLRQNDLSSLLTQLNGLARKQPALFIGASLVAGFAVARVGKIVASDVSRDDLPTLPEVGHASS